jgi:hypothetical protein
VNRVVVEYRTEEERIVWGHADSKTLLMVPRSCRRSPLSLETVLRPGELKKPTKITLQSQDSREDRRTEHCSPQSSYSLGLFFVLPCVPSCGTSSSPVFGNLPPKAGFKKASEPFFSFENKLLVELLVYCLIP